MANILTVPFRQTSNVSLTPFILSYISEHYDQNSEQFKPDCAELDALRNQAIRVHADNAGEGIILRYYGVLMSMCRNFPLDVCALRDES